MGYLFENAEKMDIQAERRNTRQARERADAAERSLQTMIARLAGLCREEGLTKEAARIRLHELYQVSEPDLERYFETCWQSD